MIPDRPLFVRVGAKIFRHWDTANSQRTRDLRSGAHRTLVAWASTARARRNIPCCKVNGGKAENLTAITTSKSFVAKNLLAAE